MNINIDFSRSLLSAVLEEVKPLTTPAERKAAWVYHFERANWEFHGPAKFYWHGRADNAYEARFKGWTAWLATKPRYYVREVPPSGHGKRFQVRDRADDSIVSAWGNAAQAQANADKRNKIAT